MLDYLKTWLITIQTRHSVNPIIFAVIYFTSVIPFWFSIYKIITGIKRKDFTQVRSFSIILGIIIIAPFTYVAIFGHNLPFWFWIVAICIIGYSTYSVIRRIKAAK